MTDQSNGLKEAKAIAAIAEILEPFTFRERSRIVSWFFAQELTEVSRMITEERLKFEAEKAAAATIAAETGG